MTEVIEDWETFVQSILGRDSLPSWEEMWAFLQQEEVKRLTKVGSSGRGSHVKKEEEDVALASLGQQRKKKMKKKDICNVRCFKCG